MCARVYLGPESLMQMYSPASAQPLATPSGPSYPTTLCNSTLSGKAARSAEFIPEGEEQRAFR